MEYALTGDMLPSERAYELGLVNRLTEAGGALEGALELAAAVGANGPLAITASKQVVAQSIDWTREEMFTRQKPLIDHVFASEDAREGARAFAEKRKPNWTGK
jgi:enoyl-CoA hydratase